MYRRFLFCYIIITIGALCLVAAINFVIDPSSIYLKKSLNDKYVDDYTNKLIFAKTGIKTFANERVVKMSLAGKISKYDCIILGSSHVMSLSVITNSSSLKAMYPSVMNLGVSGGSFEDVLIFSHKILQSGDLSGKTILIGIDPWFFKWNMDSRYGIYKDELGMMKKELHVPDDSIEPEAYKVKLMRNLINLNYFEKSIEFAQKTGLKKLYKELIPNNEFMDYNLVDVMNYDVGIDYAVTLADGSHVYDRTYIKSSKTLASYIADVGYKLSGNFYDEDVIGIFKNLIELYQKNGAKVAFVLTPYHKCVFSAENEKNWSYLREVEKRTQSLATEGKIAIYGSYDPEKIGCTEDEFFDFMHPRRSCLAKIIFGQSSADKGDAVRFLSLK